VRAGVPNALEDLYMCCEDTNGFEYTRTAHMVDAEHVSVRKVMCSASMLRFFPCNPPNSPMERSSVFYISLALAILSSDITNSCSIVPSAIDFLSASFQSSPLKAAETKMPRCLPQPGAFVMP
jgi:hypothetical protein